MPDLFDNVVNENNIFRGAGRVVYAAASATFPTKIADVINKSTYVLQSAWSDLGGTTPDGVKIVRGLKIYDGVAVDQLKSPVLQGEVETWTGSFATTMLEADLVRLQQFWEGGAVTQADVGPPLEQKVPFGSPSAVTERRVAVIQKNSKTGKLRMIVIRRAKLDSGDMELGFQSSDASSGALNLVMLPDTAAALTDNMFTVFQET